MCNPSVNATILLLTLDKSDNDGTCVRYGGINGTNGSPGSRPGTYLTGGKSSVVNILLLYYHVADFFAEDRRAAFRSRSFVGTCRRLPTQVHIPFRWSSLTLLMKTKTASMNLASALSFTTFAFEMLEACRLLSRDPYISSFREPNS